MFAVELVLSKSQICRDLIVEPHEVIKILLFMQFLYIIAQF